MIFSWEDNKITPNEELSENWDSILEQNDDDLMQNYKDLGYDLFVILASGSMIQMRIFEPIEDDTLDAFLVELNIGSSFFLYTMEEPLILMDFLRKYAPVAKDFSNILM